MKSSLILLAIFVGSFAHAELTGMQRLDCLDLLKAMNPAELQLAKSTYKGQAMDQWCPQLLSTQTKKAAALKTSVAPVKVEEAELEGAGAAS